MTNAPLSLVSVKIKIAPDASAQHSKMVAQPIWLDYHFLLRSTNLTLELNEYLWQNNKHINLSRNKNRQNAALHAAASQIGRDRNRRTGPK
jgi:hypothetical protein